uniref:Reverse transcriptase domain-containing protein n=1 Tax=Strongyloides papillosus TaxID=174720 RepID=A0A0N5C520_STREA
MDKSKDLSEKRRKVKIKLASKLQNDETANNLIFATYNCRSFPKGGEQELIYQMNNQKIDLITLTETRSKKKQTVTENGFLISLSDGNKFAGVEFAINNRLRRSVIQIEYYNERIGYLEMKIDDYEIGIWVIYFYTECSNNEEEKEKLIEILIEKVKSKQHLHQKMIMGDFNACISNSKINRINGGRNFENIKINSNGEYLLKLAIDTEMAITNTHFQKKPHKRWTHELPGPVNKREYKEDRWKYRRTLDYILVKDIRSINDTQALNKEKFDPFSSDHRPLYCKIVINKKLISAMKYARYLQKKKKINNFDEILSGRAKEIQKEIENKLKSNTSNVDKKIETLTKVIKQQVERLKETTKKNSRDYYEGSTKSMLNDRMNLLNKLKSSSKIEERRKIRQELLIISMYIRKKMKEDKELKEKRIVEEYLAKRKGIKKARKELITDKIEILIYQKVIQKYYEDLFKLKEEDHEYVQIFKNEINNIEKIEEKEESFTMKEMFYAFKSLSKYKAMGVDNLLSNDIKLIFKNNPSILLKLVNEMFEKVETPKTFKISKVILLFKKGLKEDLNNYRCLSITTHLYKLVTILVLNKLRKYTESENGIGKYQGGFRPNKDCSYCITTVEKIIEKRLEYGKSIGIICLDFSKAFDKMYREGIE